MQSFQKFDLADPDYYQPKTDILIGAEYFEKCFHNKLATVDSLTLSKSIFGWVVSGPVLPAHSFVVMNSTPSVPPRAHVYTTFAIENQLRRFWEIEEAKPVQRSSETKRDD